MGNTRYEIETSEFIKDCQWKRGVEAGIQDRLKDREEVSECIQLYTENGIENIDQGKLYEALTGLPPAALIDFLLHEKPPQLIHNMIVEILSEFAKFEVLHDGKVRSKYVTIKQRGN